MPAHSAYLTTILNAFSTHVGTIELSQQHQREARAALERYLAQKSDFTRWEPGEIESFLNRTEKALAKESREAIVGFIKSRSLFQTTLYLDEYLEDLEKQGAAETTVRNYRSDLRQYLEFARASDVTHLLTKPKVSAFVYHQQQKGLKNSTLSRRLASMDQFGRWLVSRGLLETNLDWLHQDNLDGLLSAGTEQTPEELPILDHCIADLASRGMAETTQENYRSDLRQLVQFAGTQDIKSLTSPTLVQSFLKAQAAEGHSDTTVARRKAAVHALQDWAERQGYLTTRSKFTAPNLGKLASRTTNSIPRWARSLQASRDSWMPYFNLGLIILFFVGLGLLGYRQLIVNAPINFAYPTTPERPDRVLSFQGRLTDTAQNPITSSTDAVFTLHDAETDGTQLWDSGTCAVVPDQDGIFTVGLGDDCGSEISSDVFSENANVWLEVEVESETLTPRQPIRTVAYALNAETLQGYPVFDTAVANSILAMDENGDVTLGSDSPTITSTTGTFTLEGQALTLQTASGTNGDITLAPDGTGGVIIESDLDVQGYLHAPGATISATYAGIALNVTGGEGRFWDGTASVDYADGEGEVYVENDFEADSNVYFSGLTTGTDNTVLVLSGDQVVTDEIDSRVWGSTLVDGSGTANYVARFSDTDTLTTGVIVDDGTNVGIGTSSPGEFFVVEKNQNGNTRFQLRNTSSGSGASAQFLVSNGNDFSDSIRFSTLGTGFTTFGGFKQDGAVLAAEANLSGGLSIISRHSSTGDIRFYTGGANDANQRVTILSGGNVGIGDVTPASLFSVGNGDLFQVTSAGIIAAIDGVAHTIDDVSGDLSLTSNSGAVNTTGTFHVLGNTLGLNSDADSNNVLGISAAAGSAASDLYWGDDLLCDVSEADCGTGGTSLWANTDNVYHAVDEYASVIDLVIGGDATASADIQLLSDGSAVFNEQGNDADFRVEGSGAANALFVQGSDGNVGIGTNTPAATLQIEGSGNVLLLPQEDTAAAPTLSFGDGDTGLYESADDTVNISIAGSLAYTINAGGISSSTGFGLRRETPSATNPTLLPNDGDADTGLGANAADQLSLIAGGEEVARLTEGGTSGNIFAIAGDSLTSGGTDDKTLSVVATLNDGGAAGGSDTFSLIEGNITETDVTGWDDVYLLDLQVGGTPQFTVDDSGNTATTGTFTLPNSNTLTGVSNYTQFSNGISVAGGTTYYFDSSGDINANQGTFAGLLTANGTFDANGQVTIGDGGDTVAIDSSDWDITAAGNASGLGSISADGTITLSGLGTDTDNTVLILNSSNEVTTDEIDSRVWGSSLIDGSGSANYLSKWSDGDTLTNSIVYDDGTNVGIGTTSTAALLDVVGSADNQQLIIQGHSSQTNNIVEVLNSSGVVLSSITDGRIQIADASATGNPALQFLQSTTARGIIQYNDSGDIFDIDSDGSVSFSPNNSEAVLINTDGNVGIGDSSPASLLSVGNGDLFQVNSSGEIASIGGVAHAITDGSGDLTLTSNSGIVNTAGVFHVLGSTLGLNSDADSDNVFGLSASAGQAGSDLYWGDDLLCDVSEADCGTGGTSLWANTDNVYHGLNEYASVIDLVIGGDATASADIQLYSDGSAVFNEQGNDADFRVEASGEANALLVQGSDGNVGIGTSAPDSLLEVAGRIQSSITGYSLKLGDDSDADTYLLAAGRGYFGYTPGFTVVQGGSGKGINFNVDDNTFASGTAMTLNSSGNLGVGVSDPDTTLEVLDTTTQLKLSYDSSNYASWRVLSSGVSVIESNFPYYQFVDNSTAGTTLVLGEDSSQSDAGNDSALVIYGDTGSAVVSGNISHTGSNFSIGSGGSSNIQISSGGGIMELLSGGAFRTRDSGNTDWVSFSHDGTDYNIAGTNTTDINISGITALNVAADIIPNADSTYDLGSGSLAWAEIHGDTIYQGGNQVCDDSGNCPGGIWANTDNVYHGLDEYASVIDLVIGGDATASADIQLYSDGSAVFNEQGNDADFRVEGSGAANALFVQGSDGNVGIGTSAPGEQLHVYAGSGNLTTSIESAGANSVVSLSLTNDAQIWSVRNTGSSSDNFQVYDGTAGRTPFVIEPGAQNNEIYIDSNGGIGIGTSSPVAESTADLHIVDGTNAAIRFEQDTSSGDTAYIWDLRGRDEDFALLDQTGGTSPFVVEAGANDNSVYINSDGNVGIGDASPASLLSVGDGDLFQVDSSGIISSIDGVAHTIEDSSGNLTLTSNGGTIFTLSDLDVFDQLALGDEAGITAGISFFLNESYTDTSGTTYGAYIQNQADAGSASTATHIGTFSQARLDTTNGPTTLYGAIGSTNLTAAGTVTSSYGLYGQALVNDGVAATITNQSSIVSALDAEDATVTAARALHITTPSVDTGSITGAYGLHVIEGTVGAGSITTQYGILINAMDNATNNYGLWGQAGDWVLDEDGNGGLGGNSNGGDLFLGEGQDLELYHDGTNSYITNNTGDLYIGDASTDDVILSNNGGNVGIGTTTPGSKLQVAGDITPSADDTYDLGTDSLRWQDLYLGPSTLHIGTSTSDEYTVSYNTSSNYLGFNVNGSGDPEIVFNSAGNVGIGSTAPAQKLDVAGYAQAQRFVDNANDSYYLDPAATGNSLLTAGNIGIGTTTAGLQLDVVGDTRIRGDDGWDGAGDLAIARLSGGNDIGIAGRYGTGLILSVFGSGASGYLGTDALDAVTILDTSGNVGIGSSAPTAKLDVAGSATISGTLAIGLTNEGGAGTCDASTEGGFYYDKDYDRYRYCDGIQWTSLGASGESLESGDGSDGSISITSATTFNSGTDVSGVDMGIEALNASSGYGQANADRVEVASTTDFNVGDDVLVIQMTGAGAGNYEYGTIESISSNDYLDLEDSLNLSYQSSGAQVIRIPQFTTVTLSSSGSIAPKDWDGSTGGVLVFRANSTVTVGGSNSITADENGYRGGSARGESYTGTAGYSVYANGGGGASGQLGHDTGNIPGSGGGGGHASNGGPSFTGFRNPSDSSTSDGVEGGYAYGSDNLQQIFPGSAGGGGYPQSGWTAGDLTGGDGGGIVIIHAETISNSGTISSNGEVPAGGTYISGGGGAGGSIYLRANTLINTGTIETDGANGDTPSSTAYASANSGSGANGRIRIDTTEYNGIKPEHAGSYYQGEIGASSSGGGGGGGSSLWAENGSDVYFNTGNVGIGTSSPSFALHAYGSTNGAFDGVRSHNATDGTSSFSVVQSTVDDHSISMIATGDNYTAISGYNNSGFFLSGANQTGGMVFNTQASAPIRFVTGGLGASFEKVRIASDGNVGIGTTSPDRPLHVDDTSGVLVGTLSKGIYLFTSGSGEDISSSNTMHLNYNNNQNVSIGEGGTSNLFVSGNIGIGTTTAVAELHLAESTSAANTIQITNSTTGHGTSDGLELGLDSGENAYVWNYESNALYFGAGGSERVRILSGGNVGIGSTNPAQKLDVAGRIRYTTEDTDAANNWVCYNATNLTLSNCTSLRAYKENIVDLGLGLSTVLELQPRQYDVKLSGETTLGFIAEEIEAVNPLLATYDKDGNLEGVKLPQLTAVLTKAIQEQQLLIDVNTGDISTLASNLSGLNTDVVNLQNDLDSSQVEIASNSSALQTAIADIDTLQSDITDLQTITSDFATEFSTDSLGVGVPAPASGSGKLIDTTSGAFLSTGGVWTNTSDENLKENFVTLDSQEILDKIVQLDVEQWNYIAEDDNITHIGPTAQQFYQLFGLGGDNTRISTIDPAGIALLGIQGLKGQVDVIMQAIQELQTGLSNTQQQIADLSSQLESSNNLSASSTQTSLITPVDEQGDLLLRLGADTASDSSSLKVENTDGELLAEINSDGTSLLGDLLVAEDASIAGDLSVEGEIRAQSSRLSQLESRVAEFEELRAQTGEFVELASQNLSGETASIAGRLQAGELEANSILGFEDKVAAALQAPSLLQQLTTSFGQNINQTQPVVDILASAGYTYSDPHLVTDASSSAQVRQTLTDLELDIEDVSLVADAVFINRYFDVNGSAYIADSLGLGGSLLIGEGMQVGDGYIEYQSPTSSTLALQPSGNGQVDLLAGTLVVDGSGQVQINGDVYIAGNVEVGGTLLTNLLEPTNYDEPLQVKVAGIATESGEVKQSRFEIVGELGSPVATISAEGQANFAAGIGVESDDLTTLTNSLAATPSGSILNPTTKTSGKAIIPAGSTETTIYSTRVTEDALVYITPSGSTQNQVLFVKAQQSDNQFTPLQDGYFTVGFATPINTSVEFSWWVVN